MRIIAHRKIAEFYEDHPNAKIPLEEWYLKTKKSEWGNFADVKNTFNSVDYAGNQRYIFNIKGNEYRLVAMILFQIKRVYIRFIGTHEEYDKIDCSKI
ncbi:MAG: type II toxin-antitoxin system HigB family toxin [Bacteroidales bacterium]|jgi:mRNA interferase HigB|nr:type II toxin-antitoxin system HigB family toxin [Bacteroidales bacterium]